MNCLNCNFAVWEKTTNGSLHPNGRGRCTWTHPKIALPIAYYYLRDVHLGGGSINRKELEPCPAWQPKGESE